MKPQTVHLLVLSVSSVLPAAAGAFFVVTGASSHSELSPLAELIGGAMVLGAALYAIVSSLLVWKLGSTISRVLQIHAGLVVTAGALFMVTRMRFG